MSTRQIRRIFIFSLLSLFICTGLSATLIITIGSVAPENTPWDITLKKLGSEVKEITKGEVKFKIISAPLTESDMIRRLRRGEIGGVAVANNGLICLHRDVFALNIPLLFTTDEEFSYVFNRMKSLLEQKIEEKGYKVVVWMLIGWLKFFTNDPISHPAGLQSHKLSVDTGDQERNRKVERAWERAGYKIVPSDFRNLRANLRSGRVNAFYLPALLAIQGDYTRYASNLCPLRIAPVLGGIVFSKETWEEIPQKYRAGILESAKRISANLYNEVEQKEVEFIKKGRTQGLNVNELPPGAREKWYGESKSIIEPLVGEIFSEEIYNQLHQYLKEYKNRESTMKEIPLDELHQPHALTVGEDRFFIMEGSSIHAYSLNNFKLIKTFGKSGVGPGEFMGRPYRIDTHPAYIIVHSEGRMSYFTKDGEYIKQTNALVPDSSYQPIGDCYVGMKLLPVDETLYCAINLFDSQANQVIKEIHRFKHPIQPDKPINPTGIRGSSYRLHDNKIFIDNKNGTIDVYNTEGEKIHTIEPKIEKVKISDIHKTRYMDFWESNPVMREKYTALKNRFSFPDYFPLIRDFQVVDNKIYVLTHKEEKDKSELLVYSLKGKLLKKSTVPLLNIDVLSPETSNFYAIKKGKLYVLIKNHGNQNWELHISLL